ncbi:hypothetical protein HIM_07424 [Hirsutella minnesotensis 3608]|uniref:Xylanolytic transcriptional activator regulatory domain-containing protein n=1 Tax=Hirsutella minnesotensis 3608 TaxID=1043627 RepID=A0A0F7ZYX4_9HYPO|nr:hypothetical protein HIM_07424 [Hirsutella minnesotensis 3608]
MDISDLLVRHEKLVHLNEGSKDGGRPRRSSTSTTAHKSSSSDCLGRANAIPANESVPGRHHARTSSPFRTPLQHSQQQQIRQQLVQAQQKQVQTHYHHGMSGSNSDSAHVPQDHRATPRTVACNLDVLSDAALATEVHPSQAIVNEMTEHQDSHQNKNYGQHLGGYIDRPREDHQHALPPGFASQPANLPYDDYSLFLDDPSTSPHLTLPQFEPEQSMTAWTRSPGRPSPQFTSRFASLAPDIRESGDTFYRPHEDLSRVPSLRISALDHGAIKNRIDEYSGVLPSDFVFPSRHTLTRFLEGYITGFHEHVPFLHLPTLSPAEIAPELLLSISAVGAQYRFESNRGYALWYAAKAIIMEQIRRRHSSEVHALLPTAAAYSPHSTRPSPTTTYRHSFASAQSERPVTQDTHREPYSPNTPQARLETIQAALILFAVGLWGAKTILQDALSLQSTLALLIREEGLHIETNQAMLNDWDSWVRLEGSNRTKLIAYSLFNLCSTAYDMPPLIMTSELHIYLPVRARLWRAESAWQWQELRQSTPVAEITLHDAISRLFGRGSPGLPMHLSTLGHYVLMHAVIQHVYLLKQTSFTAGLPYDFYRRLKPEDVEEVAQALRTWQAIFDQRRQLRAAESGQYSGIDSANGGPLAFNSTALLRLVNIRLYADMPPSRSLETRDSMLIASSLNSGAPLIRGPRLNRAVFQAVHALSTLVKAGVNYVARAKSTEWSIQLSLCNFECALLLAKWLIALSSITTSDPPASPEERQVLGMIRRMLDETEFAVPIDPSLSGQQNVEPGTIEVGMSDGARVRQLASAVVRLWAETFKGTHVFDVAKVMGASLDGYADLLAKPVERGSIGKMMAPEAGMG